MQPFSYGEATFGALRLGGIVSPAEADPVFLAGDVGHQQPERGPIAGEPHGGGVEPRTQSIVQRYILGHISVDGPRSAILLTHLLYGPI